MSQPTDAKRRTKPGDLILGAARIRNEARSYEGTASENSLFRQADKPAHVKHCPNAALTLSEPAPLPSILSTIDALIFTPSDVAC